MLDASKVEEVCRAVDFVFCAVNMPKPETKALEIALAKTETPVVSNNSAQRGEPDVPMMMPEVNIDHAKVIDTQRKRLGTKRGFVSVKPNCSIQSYVPARNSPLLDFGIEQVSVCTYQAISGAGKTFKTWPERVDVIQISAVKKEKGEQEPLKIWGIWKTASSCRLKSPLSSALSACEFPCRMATRRPCPSSLPKRPPRSKS